MGGLGASFHHPGFDQDLNMPLPAAHSRIQECGERHVGPHRSHGAIQQYVRVPLLGSVPAIERILGHWKGWKMLVKVAGGGNYHRPRR